MATRNSSRPGFEREKWLAEMEFKKEELGLRKRELDAKDRDLKYSRWSSPLVLAISGATIAAVGNIAVTYHAGTQQRSTDELRHTATQRIEREKAESQLILEMIRTANP